jgi:hypothetical protein
MSLSFLSFTTKDTVTYLKELLRLLRRLAIIADMSYKRFIFNIEKLIMSATKKRLLLS